MSIFIYLFIYFHCISIIHIIKLVELIDPSQVHNTSFGFFLLLWEHLHHSSILFLLWIFFSLACEVAHAINLVIATSLYIWYDFKKNCFASWGICSNYWYYLIVDIMSTIPNVEHLYDRSQNYIIDLITQFL
jgi:hypothetical protein